VLEALRAFREQGYTPFNPPGHRQGRGVDPRVLEIVGEAVFAADVISVNGLDDRLMRDGVIEQAQQLMADAVDAEHTFFSTCGSSLSVKSAMLSVAGPHEKLIVPRHAHKSVVSGLILSGVDPVWLSPHWDAERHLSHPPGPGRVRELFQAEPEAKGMLLVTPTDYGTCGDIAAIAEVCHEFGKPLIVDEAWGAHLPFHPDLPQWGMDADADVVVTSVHKSGAAVEQSSVFHLQGDLVDPYALKSREDLLGTTSPTSLVYATLDGWRRHMVQHGRELLTAALALAHATRAAIDELPGLRVMGEAELIGEGLAHALDPLKVVVVGVLLDALGALAKAADGMPAPRPVDLPTPEQLQLETAMLPRDAFFAPVEQVPADQAVGRISAEMVTPYPPGAPAVLPGEVITEAVVDYVRSGLRAGMELPDPADSGLDTFRVVARKG